MTIFGQMRQNGQALGPDAVIAVYHGDELRGKGRPFSQGSHTNIFYLQVWGDTTGQALVFKVSTGGEIVEVDQGLTYQVNGEVGSPSAYYYVDLPSTFLLGDANGDGTVSIADVTAIINRINNATTGTFIQAAADVNGDGIISIADVTGVINIINK